MRIRSIGLLVLVEIGVSICSGLFAAEPERHRANEIPVLNPSREANEPAVAVVELFTSEGCSSCPPADHVLQSLVEQQAISGDEVYALSFHVDYWDKLGWRDRFADKTFTTRQRYYAKTLQLDQIYTPQMIVNGQIEFVGSNRETASEAISTALRIKSSAKITLSALLQDSTKVAVKYLAEAPAGSVLNIAIVEVQAQSDVKRGENAGATLSHANVVRVFKTLDLSKQESGTLDIQLPKGLSVENTQVIGYVQDRSLRVHGAAKAAPKK